MQPSLFQRKQLAGAQSDKDKDFYTNCCDGLPRDGVLRSLDRQIDALAMSFMASPPPKSKSWKDRHKSRNALSHAQPPETPSLPAGVSANSKARGRDAILTSMRHWLAGVLAKERPALFRDLDSIGEFRDLDGIGDELKENLTMARL